MSGQEFDNFYAHKADAKALSLLNKVGTSKWTRNREVNFQGKHQEPDLPLLCDV